MKLRQKTSHDEKLRHGSTESNFREKLDRDGEKETEKLIKNSARDLFVKKSMIEVQLAGECLGACLY